MADQDAGGFAAFMAAVDGNKEQEPQPQHQDAAQNQLPVEPKLEKSQDEYHYEEQQEREAMMKSYHHPMKQWFRQRPHLADKYGAFPLFWQELKTWTPYRDVLKEYIQFTEHGDPQPAKSEPSTVSQAIKSESSAPTTPNPASSTVASNDKSVTNADGNGDAEQPKKRRKSRWGDPVTEDPASGGEKRRKKSRWAPAAPANATMGGALLQKQRQTMLLRAQLDGINQKMKTVAADAARLEKDPNRSPSPPPQYDTNGKRTNTREVRMRAALEKRRRETIDQLVKVNPLFRPPSDYVRQRLHRKIYIPIKEFPQYNFIGLIIGPRGNTQKRMERETNCKIAIRGKGSVKEGSKGKKMNSDENDDLHVLITGDKEEDIERAAKEVQSLLVPVDDTKNSHKQKQLRELALINGTLRDDDYCHICGEKGHRQWECPNRDANRGFKAANVKCAICGDASHPTRDCTMKRASAEENAAIDKEYQSFMQQLGEAPIISSATKERPTESAASTSTPMSAATSTAATSSPSAPWLQPSKTSSSFPTQPWMANQQASAPGTSSYPPAQGMHTSSVPALGSTPATAFPPATAVAGDYGYQTQTQDWGAGSQQGWNGSGYSSSSYYGSSWDQGGAAASSSNGYQSYGHYGPSAGAGTSASASTDSSVTGGYPAADANGAGQYQYPPYNRSAPQ